MARESCQICGSTMPGQITRQSTVPRERLDEAGIRRWKTMDICRTCKGELDRWYAVHINEMTFDVSVKRFRPKSPLHLLREYEVAYQWFVQSKKEQFSHLQPDLF